MMRMMRMMMRMMMDDEDDNDDDDDDDAILCQTMVKGPDENFEPTLEHQAKSSSL